MAMSLTSTALANPSTYTVNIEKVAVDSNDAETQALVAQLTEAGKKLTVQEPSIDNYRSVAKSEEVAKVVTTVVESLNDDTKVINMQEIQETLATIPENQAKTVEVNGVSKFQTTSYDPDDPDAEAHLIDPLEYEPLTKFADLAIIGSGDDAVAEYRIGDDGETIVTVTAKIQVKDFEAIQGLTTEDLTGLLIMQVDPVTGEQYFIEISEDDIELDEDGNIVGLTIKFPCLGAFCFMEKTAVEDEAAENETEAVDNSGDTQ
jgi:hypothetical protein